MKFVESYGHLALVEQQQSMYCKEEYKDSHDEIGGGKSTRYKTPIYKNTAIQHESAIAKSLCQTLKLGNMINASLSEAQRLFVYMIANLTRSDTCLVFDFTSYPTAEQASIDIEMRGICHMPLSVAAISSEQLPIVLNHYADKGEHRLVCSAYGLFWVQQKLH